MAKFYDQITEYMQKFVEAQHLFFVASAPLSGEGHVNVSPKGREHLRVLSDHSVAYLDLIGSGNETSAHLLENGRVTFMWCAFDGAPNIVRFFGTGRTVLPSDPEWTELRPLFADGYINVRQIIVAEIHKTMTSCGYGVPFMDYVGERDTMERWAETKGEEELVAYQCEKNSYSLDGLPTPLKAELIDK
ncbi:MAG: pyridoxamine 5'-phosphate oxidase family protein [Chloroflexi bacterium]|nr:pyridoxamine 5'-phosphate oxidase family protein [Chloroflexota bacterium]